MKLSIFKKVIIASAILAALAAVLSQTGLGQFVGFPAPPPSSAPAPPPTGGAGRISISKDKILASQELGEIIKYQYISNVEVPPENYNGLQEDITKRTSNAQFFYQGEKDSQEQWVAKFYSQQPFYKDEKQNKWYQTETATTTIQAFQDQTKVSWFEKLFRKAIAQTSYYVGVGDGHTEMYALVWDTAHDAVTALYVSYAATTFRIQSRKEAGAANYTIRRGFFPTDTSALPDNAVISAATFYLWADSVINTDNDGDDWVNVVQTSQPDHTLLALADYDLCGAVDNPTEGATRVAMTGISTVAYTTFALNATGLTWISLTDHTLLGMREGHDAIDSPVAEGTNDVVTARASEYAGTANDPYLSVSYTTTSPVIFNKNVIFNRNVIIK